MKKIVIIGANDFQNQLILKAKEMGFETHVFAWQDGSIGERTADHFYPVSIVEIDKILEKCREIKPDAVATIASDLANITVSKVAAGLGLPGNTPECIELSTNKYAMRSAFLKAGLPTPKFYKVDRVIPELMGMELPVIVKPTDRSGSRAITKITAYDQLEEAIKEAPKKAAKAVVTGVIMNQTKKALDSAVGKEESAKIFQANDNKKIGKFWKVSPDDKDDDD